MQRDNQWMLSLLAFLTALFPIEALVDRFDTPETAIVLLSVKGDDTIRSNPSQAAKPLPPCSTFKIWNTAIGLETGVLKEANEPFYVWDGKKRWLEAWNRDLTLKEAFAVSCVPGYQELARKIGPERMNDWIARLSYGNRDTSAGNDVFWLAGEGRKPLLISANEQAELLLKLLRGELPLSKQTVKVLREVMLVEATDQGKLFGKTGTGVGDKNEQAVGWFVGFVESEKGTFVFAAVTQGPGRQAEGEKVKYLGPEMKERVIALFKERGAL